MKTPSLWMIAAGCLFATASVAHAHSAYDGSWDLVFVTQTGLFDPSYNFTVDITDGVVTHPNLVRFKGYVAKSGSCVGDGRTNSRPAPAGSSGPPVAENGVAARELRDARAIGPPSTNDQLEK